MIIAERSEYKFKKKRTHGTLFTTFFEHLDNILFRRSHLNSHRKIDTKSSFKEISSKERYFFILEEFISVRNKLFQNKILQYFFGRVYFSRKKSPNIESYFQSSSKSQRMLQDFFKNNKKQISNRRNRSIWKKIL